MSSNIGLVAFGWGALSALSLPLGALIGLSTKPGRRLTSALMAFGGGALLFALTLELFGEAIFEKSAHGSKPVAYLMIGAVLGGILYEILNQALNSQGGFLRKFSTTKRYLLKFRWMTAKNAVKSLGKVKLLRELNPSEVSKFVPYLKHFEFEEDQILMQEGEEGDWLFFITEGKIEVSREKDGKKEVVAMLGPGDVLGEVTALNGGVRTATAEALQHVECWGIKHEDFKKILVNIKPLEESLKGLVQTRLAKLGFEITSPGDEISGSITKEDVHQAAKEAHGKGNAALAIWMGIFLDSIPESMVIGILAQSPGGMSVAFIAGVFMANFPEALSSSVGMKAQGMKPVKIFLMWMSLCIVTGIGALIGASIFPANPTESQELIMRLVEGLAAGAMLTMIAETMLPEAFEQGGAVVGLSTLSGFLSALSLKVF